MLKKHSTSMLLIAHALALGALPLTFLWATPRFLPADQMGPFLQYWAVFNVISLGFHGSVESLVPRILSRQGGLKKLMAISLIAALLSILASISYLNWIKVQSLPEVFLGITVVMILSIAHSAGRGSAISKGKWGKLAVAAASQSLVGILSLAVMFSAFDPRIAHIFIALASGYLASILITSSTWFDSQNFASDTSEIQSIRTKTSIAIYLGFSFSAFLVLLVPVLPIVLSGEIFLSQTTLLLLTVVPYLVRVGSSVGNTFTPIVLNRYQTHPEKRVATFVFHIFTMTTPGLVAVIITGLLSPSLFEWYLNREVDLLLSTVILLAVAELLFSISSVFRTYSLSTGGPSSQLMAWLVSGITLSWGLLQAPSPVSIHEVAGLLFQSAVILNGLLALMLILKNCTPLSGASQPKRLVQKLLP